MHPETHVIDMIDFNKDIDFEMSDGGAHAIPIFAEIHANGDDKLLKEKELKDVPVLALRNMVLFPGMTMPVMVGRSKSLNAIKESQRTGEPLAVVCQIDSDVEDPDKNDLYPVGTVAEVMVQVAMSGNAVNRSKISLPYIVDHSIFLFMIESTTVNEETFFRLVAYHISVLTEHVADKPLNLQHFMS